MYSGEQFICAFSRSLIHEGNQVKSDKLSRGVGSPYNVFFRSIDLKNVIQEIDHSAKSEPAHYHVAITFSRAFKVVLLLLVARDAFFSQKYSIQYHLNMLQPDQMISEITCPDADCKPALKVVYYCHLKVVN